MATTGTNGQSAGVLLVDAESLLLQGENEEDSSDVTADLLHQALHGSSAINGSDNNSENVGEVKFDALSENANDVVAIFQVDSGETHTIKITHEQLETLGLHLEGKTRSLNASSSNIVVNNLTTATPNPAENLMGTGGGIMDQDSLLPTLPNMVTEGRIIDEEGNIVHANNINILPTSLNSFMEQEVGQAITIVPQYGMDGSFTYAVKLKDNNELTSSDFTLTTADVISKEEPKTGLDIEVEMARVNSKRSLTSLEEAIGPVAIPISSSGSVPISSAISLPTLPLTATIPRVTNSNKFVSVVPSSAPTPVHNSYFRILPDRSAMNIGALTSAVQPSVNMQPIQTNLTNIVPDPVVHPVVSKLQSPIGFPLTASNLNTTLASGRNLNVSTSSQLGLNVFSIMNPSNGVPATSTTTFRTIASNSVSLKHPIKPAPPRVSNMQTTTSRLLPITSTKVTGVNVLPSPSATTTQPAIAAAAITKVCQPISAAGSRAPNQLNTKPLGSSENPIQLVQQGQTFHSMQALSQSQLHQIATVLQQKHIGGMPKKNVVFDEQTKTRIVYRVVYPEDVDLQQPNSPIEGRDASAFRTNVQPVKSKARGRGRPSKQSRALLQQSQSENQNPEADEEEETSKSDRKKVVARTRSGRLSRPPRHMIKDYKRLHHLDFWEPDMDDSDGGYSDYLPAAEAGSQPQAANPAAPAAAAAAAVPTEEDAANKGKELLNGLTSVKRRISSRFICPTCQKIYLGHARMARHFQLFPDHGSIEEFNQSRREENLKNGENGENTPKKSVDMKGRGRKRKKSHWNQRTPEEISEQRKNKLRQMIATCEPHELVEVVGPLIARTLTLWELLLLRLESMDRTKANAAESEAKPEDSSPKGEETRERAHTNRVTWLLIELRSLLDSVRSIAGDLLKPQGVSNCSLDNVVEIAEQALSNMLGMACGTYIANDRLLHPQCDNVPSEVKRLRIDGESQITEPNTGDCTEALQAEDMVPKEDAVAKSVSPMKLSDDIPFLNSSDDMMCAGDDPDEKRCDHDSDSVSGLQAVDDIVNERLKNLEEENVNFSVSLSSQLETSLETPIADTDTPTDLLMSDFTSDSTSMSVNNPSVISTSVPENGGSVGVSSMALLNSYDTSICSLPMTEDVNISRSSTTGSHSLETESNQQMLSSYSMALSSLSSYVAIPSNLSQGKRTPSVSHAAPQDAADSFLESLSSFEAPSCGGTSVSSYGNSVLKEESVLPLSCERPQARRQSPPKFISTFTPAETSDKPAEPITTAQRLQRDYRFSGIRRSIAEQGLELDGLDTDLVFQALTDELNCNTQN